MGAWISHNSNNTSDLFLPIGQVTRAPTPELPAAPTAPKLPLNKLECNEYAASVRTFNEMHLSSTKGPPEPSRSRHGRC
jgi:hypothetical protein